MRLLSVFGVACFFAGVTLTFNDLIAHWWGQTAGLSGSDATISVPGLALALVGIVVTVAAERARAQKKRAALAQSASPPKSEKVVLYEHGPDRPY